MNYSELHENLKRGSFDFPVELYYIDKNFPRYQMPFHWHLEYELIIVLKGDFELSLDGKNIILSEGDCVWIGDGVLHGGTPKNDCIYACIVFDLGTILHDTQLCSHSATEFLASENGFTTFMESGSRGSMLAAEIYKTLRSEEKGYEWTTVGLMWQLMGSLLATKKDSALTDRVTVNKLKNVLTYIRDNYDLAITLDELAEIANMSPRYFCRAFACLTGRTPIAYLNYYRIEIACERLITTGDSITSISFSCGFNDAGYFTKIFTREKGVTPSEFRKNRRNLFSSKQ